VPYSFAVQSNNKSKPDGGENEGEFICAVKECKVGSKIGEIKDEIIREISIVHVLPSAFRMLLF
jgi:hypothetical protein